MKPDAKPTIIIASDHAGYEFKNLLLHYVQSLGYAVEDMGAMEYKESDDYPPIMKAAAKKVSEHPDKYRAIILGGSGQGEAIVANRFPNVRTCVYYGGRMDMIIRLSRMHNDSNVLSLGARFMDATEAKDMVKLWLTAPFPADARHVRRIGLIDAN